MEDRARPVLDDSVDIDSSRSAANQENNNKLLDENLCMKSPKELFGEEFSSIVDYNEHLARQFRRQEQTHVVDDCVNDKYTMEKFGEKEWRLMCCDHEENGMKEWELTYEEEEEEEEEDGNDDCRSEKTDWEKKLNFKYADESDDDDDDTECAERVKCGTGNEVQRAPKCPTDNEIRRDTNDAEINHNGSVVCAQRTGNRSAESAMFQVGPSAGKKDGEVASPAEDRARRHSKMAAKKTCSENGGPRSGNGQSRSGLPPTGSRQSLGSTSPGATRKCSKYTTTVEITLGGKDAGSPPPRDHSKSGNAYSSRNSAEGAGKIRSAGSARKTSSPTQAARTSSRESRAQSSQQEQHVRTGSMSPPKGTYRRSASGKSVRSRSVGPSVLLQQNGDKGVSVQQKKAAWEAKTANEKEKWSPKQPDDQPIQRKTSGKRKSLVAERKAMLLGNVTSSEEPTKKNGAQEPSRRTLPPTPTRREASSNSVGMATRPKTSVRKDFIASNRNLVGHSSVPGKGDGSRRTLSASSTAGLRNSPTSKTSSLTGATTLSVPSTSSLRSSPTSKSQSLARSPTSKSAPPANLRKSDDKLSGTFKHFPAKSTTAKRRTPPPVPVKPDVKVPKKRASPTGLTDKRSSPTASVERKTSSSVGFENKTLSSSTEKKVLSLSSVEKCTSPTSPLEKKSSSVVLVKRTSPTDTTPKTSSTLPESDTQGNEVLDEVDSSHKPRNLVKSPKEDRDGHFFMKVVTSEEERLNKLCQDAEEDLHRNELSEEISGKIRSSIGKGQLLTRKKFKQFKGLCLQNTSPDPSTSLKTTSSDLAGFWDMVMIQVEDVNRMFDEIRLLKQNGWKLPAQQNPSRSKQSKTRKPMRVSNTDKNVAKKTTGKTTTTTTTNKAKEAREEARKRLMAAKKAAAHQPLQNSENDIQIFIHTDDK